MVTQKSGSKQKSGSTSKGSSRNSTLPGSKQKSSSEKSYSSLNEEIESLTKEYRSAPEGSKEKIADKVLKVKEKQDTLRDSLYSEFGKVNNIEDVDDKRLALKLFNVKVTANKDDLPLKDTNELQTNVLKTMRDTYPVGSKERSILAEQYADMSRYGSYTQYDLEGNAKTVSSNSANNDSNVNSNDFRLTKKDQKYVDDYSRELRLRKKSEKEVNNFVILFKMQIVLKSHGVDGRSLTSKRKKQLVQLQGDLIKNDPELALKLGIARRYYSKEIKEIDGNSTDDDRIKVKPTQFTIDRNQAEDLGINTYDGWILPTKLSWDVEYDFYENVNQEMLNFD